MVINASSGTAVDTLIADLRSPHTVTRDAAVARLTVIGGRAVQKLLDMTVDAAVESTARLAAFRALEAIADLRALEPALTAIDDTEATIAVAAIDLARVFLRTARGVLVLDRLTAVALDRHRPTDVRVAALTALGDLDPLTVQPVIAQLRQDPDAAVAAAATAPSASQAKDGGSVEGRIGASPDEWPDEPEALRRAIVSASSRLSLTTLHQMVTRARAKEEIETGAARAEWTAVRAAAHAALAQRGSRLALYDLRETIESAKEPVSVELLAALTTLGDVSCLDALAAAYSRAATDASGREDWWHRSLADAFRTIVRRDGVTKRHAAVKKIEKRWPGLFATLVDSR
jgi:HEAT repeat protein